MAKEQLTIEAQEAVDELWAEKGIPFKLAAQSVEACREAGFYTVHFSNSRLNSLFIYWNPAKESFKGAVRAVCEHTVCKRSPVKIAIQS